MFRTFLLASVLLVPIVFLAASTTASPAAAAGGSGALDQEPLLVHDVTGFGFAGNLIHRHLAVYDNGVVSISSVTDFPSQSKGAVKFLAPNVVRQLFRELSTNGAFALPDQVLGAADIPLSTLTVFQGETNANAHTFSYWAGLGAYAPIDAAVNQFVATHFPGF